MEEQYNETISRYKYRFMKITRTQFKFIINNDIEKLVSYLMEDYGMSMIDAFGKVYNSQIYEKLIDEKTGLYIQSPAYQYDYLKEELGLS